MEAVREKVKPKKHKKRVESKSNSDVVQTESKEYLQRNSKVITEVADENACNYKVNLQEDTSGCDNTNTLSCTEKVNEKPTSDAAKACVPNTLACDLRNQNALGAELSVDNNNLPVIQLEKLNILDKKIDSVCLNNQSKAVIKTTVPEIKMYPDIKMDSKVLSQSEKTVSVVKNLYPDVKSVQHCVGMEDISSIRTLVTTYTEKYMMETHMEANRQLQEFQMVVTGMERYPLFDLVKEYQNARKMSIEAHSRMKYLNSELNVKKNKLWKLIKKEAVAKGHCEDGYNVSISRNYYVKELDEDVFKEVIQVLRELEQIILSDAFFSYSNQLSKLKIEQYVFNMMNLMEASEDNEIKEKRPIGFNKTEVLKKCISILFHYQRQSTKDKDFLEICQKFLKIMVSILLKKADKSDYIFIVNHIIRCPNGIENWASHLIPLPGADVCFNKGNDIFNCRCLYYALLVLFLILNPAPDREIFLRNVRSSTSVCSTDDFTLLDSDGEEEELFEVVKNWSNEDIISLLNRIPLANMFEHALLEKQGDTMSVTCPSKEKILKMFAFATALVNVLLSGLANYSAQELSTTVECICSMMRHAVCYISDFWEHCQNLDISSKSALQAEYDRFIFHVMFNLFNFQKLGVWKFLSTLPYKCVSKKMLWNILWIFHSPNSFEENVYLTKDVELKLQDKELVAVFAEKLKSVQQCDQLYLLNTYKSIVLCGKGEEDLLNFIVHEVFQVGFAVNFLSHLSKDSTTVLLCVIKKYPALMSALLKEVEASEDETINLSLQMFKELNLLEWIPKVEDSDQMSKWLLENPLSNPKNFLARMLLTKLNWDFSPMGETVLPITLHRTVAVLVLQAYMKFDAKSKEWSVSSGLAQMMQFATLRTFVREDEGFVSWAWGILFSLKLHALDRKYPPWVQIYDGFLEEDFQIDPFEEAWLQPVLKGFEEKHPAACYLFLAMTNVGHNVRRLMSEGIQCLTVLIENQQYLATIQSLFYILPFFVKSSEDLLSNTQFLQVVNDLIIADMSVLSNISGPVVGAVLHKLAAMIKKQISQAQSLTVECATPLLKLWTSVLLKVLATQQGKNYNFSDSAKQVHFLLDVLVKIAFVDSYTRNSMVDLLYGFGNPLLMMHTNNQSSLWSKMFGSNVESYTILRKQTFPEYPVLAWYILRSETRQKHTQDLWFQVQKEMSKNAEGNSSVAALKKACAYLKTTQPAPESLPLYRYALQILETPVQHPVLPLLFQQFFHYYFERVTFTESQSPKSLGMYYFNTPANMLIRTKLKKQVQDAAEYYINKVQKSKITTEKDNKGAAHNGSENNLKINSEDCRLSFELLNVFRAFYVWIDDKNLHQPNLCYSALDPKYCCERLKLIINNDERDWFDLVSIDLMKDDLEQKVHSYVHTRQYSFTSVESDVERPREESLCERISRHLDTNKVESPPCDLSLEPPMREVEDSVFSSWNILAQLIESNQSIIFDKARSFTELASKLKQSNCSYKNLVPQEFYNEDHWETCNKSCHKGLNCSGSVTFKLKLQRHAADLRVKEKLESNRIDHRIIQDQLLNLPVSQLCQASVHIENYIGALSRKLETSIGDERLKFRTLGVSLFYHQIEAVNKVILSVKNYAPSRNFFSTSIESLGSVFIRHEETELCRLAEAILKYPEAGELAFEIFNPNIASIQTFLSVYKIITSTRSTSFNAIFVLLNKIDLQHILKDKGVGFSERRQLFREICRTLLECGSNPADELQMVLDVLRKHFRTTLVWTFPELYEEAISFLLKGMHTNQLSLGIWYDVLHCFGVSTLSDKSSISEIEVALKKFSDNLLLPPDQQIFVSSQPINVNEVIVTLDRLHRKFSEERKSRNIYHMYKAHMKPFGIFLSLLSHSMLSLLNENVNSTQEKEMQMLNISQLWESLHQSFYPWLHPLNNEFPWSDQQESEAKFMFQIFSLSLKNFHEKLLGCNCEKSILSCVWSSYINIYVRPELRHYSVFLLHSQFLNLPWEHFYPNSEDIEGMCCVLQSNLPESKEFLAKISLKIPWIDVMKNISETKSPEYVRKTLGTLGKLMIVSGFDVSLTKSNVHHNNLKALEELSWHFLSLEDVEGLLQLYYSTSNPMNLLHEELQNNPDVHGLQFLKIVCCMAVTNTSVEDSHSNNKRLLFIHKYLAALTGYVSTKDEVTLAKSCAKFQKVIPTLFTDVERIFAKAVNPEQKMSNALPLVREAVGFLNDISDSNLEDIVMKSMLSWLKSNPRSPLLLPSLQIASKGLNQITNSVMIVECCIATRFNTDIHDPADALSIWQLILQCFQVPSSLTDEFVQACVNKNAFLTLYCYVLGKMEKTTTPESKKLLLQSMIDWIQRCEVSEADEAKCLLLWDKILELSINLACDNNLQVVKRVLSVFCCEISTLGEDKSSNGILGAIGFGRSSILSVNFRFLCRIMVAYLHLQMPVNASIRLQSMDPGYVPSTMTPNSSGPPSTPSDPSPSLPALRAVENLRTLLKNKPYSALRDLVNSAIEFVLDPRHCLIESRMFLKDYALHVFPKQHYLYALS